MNCQKQFSNFLLLKLLVSIPAEFYKHFWNVIKEDMLEVKKKLDFLSPTANKGNFEVLKPKYILFVYHSCALKLYFKPYLMNEGKSSVNKKPPPLSLEFFV